MNIFQELAKRPWLAEQGALDNHETGVAYALPAAKVGLRLLLAVVTVVFTLMVILYSERMEFGDWRSVTEPWLLWLNTVMLILSGAALHWARLSGRRGEAAKVKVGLLGGAIYAIAFVIGQILAWQSISGTGFMVMANPAIGFFYLLTGAHAVHMLGGIVALGRTILKARRVGFEGARLQVSIELCTVYWHYLLVVWLVLFGLLLFT